ncbi:hypothetical protein L6R52_01150 [Myxococcota bacterium]|nr:hypothetical protein [Myxococcota bacterium]
MKLTTKLTWHLTLSALTCLSVACSESATSAPDAAPDGGLPSDANGPVDAMPPTDADATIDDGDAGVDSGVMHNGDFERDPSRIELRGPCPQETRLGAFAVQLNETVGYTAIDGVVKDGVVPNSVREVVMEESGCRLLRRQRLVCDPPCGSGSTCNFDSTCIPAPVGQDMGPVLFLGMVRPIELMPQQPGNTYFYTRLPHPAVEAGAVVQVTAPMPGYFVPLELYGVGVRQLVPLDDRWVLTEGQPLVIHWEPPLAAARSTVYAELNIDLHGLTPLLLTCELPDTGTATISAGMISGLIGAGVTGFPEGRVARRTVDSITEPSGCVEFTVSSVRDVDLEVTGFIPCTRQAECPPNLTCDVAIQQCR